MVQGRVNDRAALYNCIEFFDCCTVLLHEKIRCVREKGRREYVRMDEASLFELAALTAHCGRRQGGRLGLSWRGWKCQDCQNLAPLPTRYLKIDSREVGRLRFLGKDY